MQDYLQTTTVSVAVTLNDTAAKKKEKCTNASTQTAQECEPAALTCSQMSATEGVKV